MNLRLLQRLEHDHRLCRRDDVLEAHFEDDSVVNSQPTIFWYLPDVTEEELGVAKEKAVQAFYCTMQRRNLKGKAVWSYTQLVVRGVGKGRQCSW